MLFTTAKRNDILYLCCEGRVKTYEEYLEFARKLDGLIAEHIDSSEHSFSSWRIMLLDAFPFNTYALGHLLRLKLYNNYDFTLATNNYHLLELLESVEFSTMFSVSIEHDPRVYKNN
ncbi:hypothetical protein [Helicobacter sp.]|uniref:hypothetical protein n=1 Tax=Helicobacter sp. TaxID=218 RepID=UPI0025BD18A4|nr:hypothetical protein [Helicobacter sp.]MBR2495264.1 hypothetical protein [Helicobacter sp.]